MEPLIRFGSGRCACACLHSLLIIIKKLPSKNFLKHCLPSFPKPYPLGNNRSHDLDLRISISKSSQNRIMLSKFRSRSKHSQFAIVFTLIFRSLSLSIIFSAFPSLYYFTIWNPILLCSEIEIYSHEYDWWHWVRWAQPISFFF